MAKDKDTIDVYLEIGKKRTFAGAIDWPGWCRVGSDEDAALQALCDYGPRYAKVLKATKIAFSAPADPSAFKVVERLEGTTTTDFGAPDVAPACDQELLDDAALRRFEALLAAYWRALEKAAKHAEGKELSKGPRGGGRELDGIMEHVLGADSGYLSRLAWKIQRDEAEDLRKQIKRNQQAQADALASATRGELPEHGPRGGKIWSPRYFVRRAGWHILDHVWEIEDRVV